MRDIFTLSKDERMRGLASAYLARPKIPGLNARPSDFGAESIDCGMCGKRVLLNHMIEDQLTGIAKILLNPGRYMLQGETLACGCEKEPYGWRVWDAFYTFRTHLSSRGAFVIKPTFIHQKVVSVYQLSIYNRKHNYYVSIGKEYFRCNFELRASNFTKYDPYRVLHITLFDLLWDCIFIDSVSFPFSPFFP